MKLKVTKDTIDPGGNHTLTLVAEDGAHGELSVPGSDYAVGQEFTLTAAAKPQPVPVAPKPVAPPPPPAPKG